MAFKTFVASTQLPAADLNTYLMKQAVIVCTSATRPSSPIEGMTIYETDTKKLMMYTTATTTWQLPWALPWGLQSVATVVANQTGIGTSLTDLTSLTVTANLVQNRKYIIRGYGQLQQQTGAGTVTLAIFDSTAAAQKSDGSWTLAAADTATISTTFIHTATSSASRTFKLQAKTTANTVNLNASSVNTAYIEIEDIGAAGSAPA